jgi:hypothetical protein
MSEQPKPSPTPRAVLQHLTGLLNQMAAHGNLTQNQELTLIDQVGKALQSVQAKATDQLGCCTVKADGQVYMFSTDQAMCIRMNGTWDPHPCA